MNKIKFNLPWDKLNDPVFTTIRSWDKAKEEYYRSHIYQKYQVWKAKNSYPFRTQYVLFHAYLEKIEVVKPSEIPLPILKKDTTINGSESLEWAVKILRNEKVIILTFTKSPPKIQQILPIMEVENGSI